MSQIYDDPILLSEDKARKHLDPFFSDIRRSGQEAWSKLERVRNGLPDLASELGKRSEASMLSDFFWASAERIFSGQGHVVFAKQKGLRLVTFKDVISLRFKKLNKQRRTSNIQTEQQEKIAHNLPLPGFPLTTYAVVGYVLDTLRTKIDTLEIIRYLGDRIMWTIPLGADTVEIRPAPLQAASPATPAWSVTVKTAEQTGNKGAKTASE
jgi:hypothetical protein